MREPNPDFDKGTMTTYRRVDGKPMDEYYFVMDREWFEEGDEKEELIKETWVRQTAETFTFTPAWMEALEEEEEE